MNQESAQNAVNSSALILAGIYFYRKLIEPATPPAGSRAARGGAGAGKRVSIGEGVEQFFGRGEVAPTGRFVVGWGFTFVVLSITVGVAPKVAGSFAWLIAIGSILGNGSQVAADISEQLNRPGLPGQVDTSSPTVNVNYHGGASEVPAVNPTPTFPSRPNTTPRDKNRPGTHPRTTLA